MAKKLQHVSITVDRKRFQELKEIASQANVPLSRLIRHRLKLLEKAPLFIPDKRVKRSFRVSEQLLDKVKEEASRIGITYCELLRLLLEQWNLENLRTRLQRKGKLAEVMK